MKWNNLHKIFSTSLAHSFFLKIGTWANICCQSSLFFFLLLPNAPEYIVVYPSCRSFLLCYEGHRLSTAWWGVLGPYLGSERKKLWDTKAEHANLTTQTRGRPRYTEVFDFDVHFIYFYFCLWIRIWNTWHPWSYTGFRFSLTFSCSPSPGMPSHFYLCAACSA